MVFRIVAIIIGLAAIGLTVYEASAGALSFRSIWQAALGIAFLGYGVGIIRRKTSFKVPSDTRSKRGSDLDEEVPKGVETVVKVISVIIIIIVSLFLVIAAIAFLGIL